MASPDDRRYAPTHEWHKPDGDLVIIGDSQFAMDELTDVTYVDIVKTEGDIKAGENFGEIESVKATSDLYCSIDGVIAEVNEAPIDDPTVINKDPFGDGWLIKVKPSDPAQLENLMAADAYDAQAGH